jgi:hypothetical protein
LSSTKSGLTAAAYLSHPVLVIDQQDAALAGASVSAAR